MSVENENRSANHEGAMTPNVRRLSAFSYVGIRQGLLFYYTWISRWLSGSLRGDLTSQAPRRAQSAIRALGEELPAHEIRCASDDAHSHSRALEVVSLAQKAARA